MISRRSIMWQAAVVALILGLPAGGSAEVDRGRAGSRWIRQAATFAVSAEYTGYIGGTMLIDGVEYRVAPNASIYVVGEGPVRGGVVAHGASLFLSGERYGQVGYVRNVIVRRSTQNAGARGGVSVAPVGAPR